MGRLNSGDGERGSRPVQLCLPLEPFGQGSFRVPGRPHETNAARRGLPLDVCTRNPRAVTCMLTAARLHGFLADDPTSLWIGVPLHTYVAKRGALAVRVLRWSDNASFEVGVQDIVVGNARVKHTTPERTVVDLIRYGRHVGGSGIALGCLRSYLAFGGSGIRVREMADALRVPAQAKIVLDTLLLSTEDEGS